MNLNDALTCLWLTKSHWGNFQVLEGDRQALQAGAWLDVLGDVDIADVRLALAELDAGGQEFPPTPGQVRTAILRKRGALAPDFDQALTEVLESLRRYGTTPAWMYLDGHQRPERPELSHPAVTETVKAMGGWQEIGASQLTDAWRAQFRKAYEAAAKRADREAVTPPVTRSALVAGDETLALPAGEAS